MKLTPKILIKSFFIIFCINTVIILSFADPLQNLIDELEKRIEKPELISLDLSESKWQRPDRQDKLRTKYRGQLVAMRVFVVQYLEKAVHDRMKNKHPKSFQFNKLTITKIRDELIKLKNNGETFKTGDLFFYMPAHPISPVIAQITECNYSHSGIILVHDDEFFVAEVHPDSDFIIFPLKDYIFPYYPQPINIGIYRYTGNLDVAEMEYILHLFDKNKKNVLFDPYYSTNPPMKTPETYFKTPVFIYCSEFLYLVYSFVLGRTNYLSNYKVSSKKIVQLFTETSPWFTAFLEAVDETDERLTKDVCVTINNFILSNEFKPIFELINTSLKDQTFKRNKNKVKLFD